MTLDKDGNVKELLLRPITPEPPKEEEMEIPQNDGKDIFQQA